MINLRFILLALMLTIYSHSASKTTTIGYSVIYTVQDEKWEDINNDIKEAIGDKGIVISYTSHAQTMLDRTAKDTGSKKGVYENAQIHLFCQALLSHKMTQANPHIISGCPYGISVYELRNKKNTIYVSYRKPPKEEKSYKGVIDLQVAIIEEALGL